MSPIKDRLNEMKQIHNGGIEKLTNSDTSVDDNAGSVKEAFQKASEIRELINVITNNTKSANEILKTNLFKITPDLQEELDSMFRTTTATSYKINTLLTHLETDLKQVKSTVSTEYRIKSVQVNSLKVEFQEALKQSSTSLEYHKNKRRELLKKSLKTACRNIADEELETLLDENKLDVFTDNHLLSVIEAKQQLSDIEDRHKELLKIENQLSEVLDLFVKIGMLVDQQQEFVDRVEYHAGEAIVHVEKGTGDLDKTVKRRKRCRKNKIYLALVISTVVLCILLTMLL